jgi:hypothetical protein
MALNRNSPHSRWPNSSTALDEEAAAAAAPPAGTATGSGYEAASTSESLPAGHKKEHSLRHSFPGRVCS